MCFDEELKPTWPEEELLGYFFDAWVWRAAAPLEAAAWSMVKGEGRDKEKNSPLWFCKSFGIKYPWLYLYIVNEGLWTWNIYSWGRRSSWDVRLLHFCGYFRMPSVREKAKHFFFFFFDLSSKNVLISRQVTQKALRKLRPCLLPEPRLYLSNQVWWIGSECSP